MMEQPAAVPPRQPLPGEHLAAFPPAAWSTAPKRLLLEELPMYGRYTQTYGRDDAGHPVRESVGYGQGAVTGTDVRSFIGGSMRFWLCSRATVDAGGTIRYRQTDNHNALTFTPDRDSGVIVNRPVHQVPDGAYLVTGPDETPRMWRAAGVRQAVTAVLRPGPVDWPRGWALLMPDGVLRLTPGGAPWGPADVYTAQPAPEPQAWGPQCTRCGRIETEHDPTRAWGGCWPKEMTLAE